MLRLLPIVVDNRIGNSSSTIGKKIRFNNDRIRWFYRLTICSSIGS